VSGSASVSNFLPLMSRVSMGTSGGKKARRGSGELHGFYARFDQVAHALRREFHPAASRTLRLLHDCFEPKPTSAIVTSVIISPVMCTTECQEPATAWIVSRMSAIC